MKPTGMRGLLLASSGLAVVLATPALGQQAEECTQHLDQIEQQVQQANLESDRQQDINDVIEGARTLAENDDVEGCMQVVAELEDLMQTVEQTQAQAEAEEPQEQAEAEEPQEQAETEEQVAAEEDQPTGEQAQAEAEEPQEKADVQGGQQADQAQEQLEQVQQQLERDEQALQEQLQQVQQQLEQAQQALQQAQQALQQAQAGQQQKQAEAEEPQEQAETEEQVTAETDQPTGEEPQAQAEAEEPQEQAETEEQVAGETDQPTGEQPLGGMAASEVLGADVINDNGETVAEVLDLVKRPGEEDLHAVLSVGGFLGIGAKQIAVPLDSFELTEDKQLLLANTTNEDLENMEEYQEADYEPAQAE